MATRWTIGKHEVQVDRAENGKYVVRIDGKVAAKPLGDDDFERRFPIDGNEYVLTRTERGSFDLIASRVMAGQAAPPMPELALSSMQRTGNPLMAYAKYAWVVVIAVVAVMMYVALGPSYPKQAARRVSTMLDDIKDGPGRESQISRGMWQRNVRVMDSTELQAVDRDFTIWRSQKDFTNGFPSYRIVSTENVKGAAVPTAIVTFEAGGKQYKVVVPEKQRMQWAE